MTDLQLPQAYEAEQSLLGCFLRSSSVYTLIGTTVKPEDFFSKKHESIYIALLSLVEKQRDSDVVAVANQLEKQGELEFIGGRVYLVELAGRVAGGVGAPGYADVVKEKSQYRRLINVAGQVVQSCYAQEQPIGELVSLLSTEAVAMLQTEGVASLKKFSEFTTLAGMSVDEYASGRVRGITTGFESLDDLFGGFQKNEYIIIGAPTGHGKTALTYCMASKEAMLGHKVAYFSAETAGEEFALRALCTDTQVDSLDWKKGRLGQDETDRIVVQMNKVTEWPFWLCEAPRIEINMLFTLAAQLHKDVTLDIIYIDYLQLLTTSERFHDRKGQVDYISVSLKFLAQRLGVPVVACCQLSREIMKRRNKEPQLIDLKESGNLEQDADIVIMPQRLKLVATRKEQKDSKLATLYVRKVRNGPTGQIDLIFEEKYTRFEEYPVQELPF